MIIYRAHNGTPYGPFFELESSAIEHAVELTHPGQRPYWVEEITLTPRAIVEMAKRHGIPNPFGAERVWPKPETDLESLRITLQRRLRLHISPEASEKIDNIFKEVQ